MIKVGQKVAPILDMHRVGVVTEIYEVGHKVMLMGGSMSRVRVAKVRLDETGEVIDVRLGDLAKVQE